MQTGASIRKYLEGTAADQNATLWDFYVSSRIQEIDREAAGSRDLSGRRYQVVDYENERPRTVLSIDHESGLYIHRQYFWDESAALDINYQAPKSSDGALLLSSFTWFAYESLHLSPVCRVDVSPKIDGRVYRRTRNLTNGENTFDLIQIDPNELADLWLKPPEFEEYDELLRWNREPVAGMAAALLQQSRERWNLV